jgi:hypothetical protein
MMHSIPECESRVQNRFWLGHSHDGAGASNRCEAVPHCP